MEIVTTLKKIYEITDDFRKSGKRISLVPTMGYFHEGHVSLMKKGREIGDILITSLFVNPTQFGPNEDFNRYPRNFERDCKIAESAGCDYLFHPSVDEMYPNDYNTEIMIKGISNKFEGAFRPVHFNGVATIVAKLFNATKPNYAVFGQKDYQQTLVVKQLTKDLLFDLKIIIAPTLREFDGLAMSSRNIYLSDKERDDALVLFKALNTATEAILNGERKRVTINAIMHNDLRKIPYIKIDYASSADANTLEEQDTFSPNQKIVLLIAVYLGKTRLIDNSIVTIVG